MARVRDAAGTETVDCETDIAPRLKACSPVAIEAFRIAPASVQEHDRGERPSTIWPAQICDEVKPFRLPRYCDELNAVNCLPYGRYQGRDRDCSYDDSGMQNSPETSTTPVPQIVPSNVFANTTTSQPGGDISRKQDTTTRSAAIFLKPTPRKSPHRVEPGCSGCRVALPPLGVDSGHSP